MDRRVLCHSIFLFFFSFLYRGCAVESYKLWVVRDVNEPKWFWLTFNQEITIKTEEKKKKNLSNENTRWPDGVVIIHFYVYFLFLVHFIKLIGNGRLKSKGNKIANWTKWKLFSVLWACGHGKVKRDFRIWCQIYFAFFSLFVFEFHEFFLLQKLRHRVWIKTSFSHTISEVDGNGHRALSIR